MVVPSPLMGRFEAKHTDRALLDIVRTVAEQADHADSQHVSQRRWNAARADAGHADAPHANKICDRFDTGWVQLLDLAFTEPDSLDRRIGRLHGEQDADWLTEQYATSLLKLIAHRLDTRMLTRAAVRRELAALRADAGAGQLVPNEEQLLVCLGGWDAALAAAGLQAPATGGSPPAAQNISEILDLCYEAHGTEPTADEIAIFARANDIQLPRRSKLWAEHVADWKHHRRARGLHVPDRPPAKHQRPDYRRPVLTPADDEPSSETSPRRRRTKTWEDRDACVAAVQRFLTQLQPGQKDGRKAYVDWSTGRPGTPSASALDRHHGGYAGVRAEARARLAATR